jgi:hypothetical protein
MGDALSIVHRPIPCFAVISLANIEGASLEIHASCDAVHHAHLYVELVAAVGVGINETGSDHMPAGINRFSPGKLIFGDDAILLSFMPTFRTVFNRVSGSMPRPLLMTMS